MKSIPFPQANNMSLIFSVLTDIGNDGLSKSDVAKKYEIQERQGSYYLDALLYLGLVEKINTKYFLTQKGVNIRLSPKDEMKYKFIQEVLDHPFISSLWKDSKNLSKEKRYIHISSRLFNEFEMANSTAKRRASSIVTWFEWIENNLE